MLSGWERLSEYFVDPPPGLKPRDPSYNGMGGRWYYNGKIRCPDCYYTTHEDDPAGLHSCPTAPDSQGNDLHVGDRVIFYANDSIHKGTLTKFNKKTGNYSAAIDEPKRNNRQNFTVHRQGRILKDES